MKKVIVSFVLACMVSSVTIMAQMPKKEHADQGNRMEQMVKELGLNEQQTADFKAAMEEYRPSKMGDVGERPSPEEMQKKRVEIDTKMRKILTEEQYKKYQKMQPQRKRN